MSVAITLTTLFSFPVDREPPCSTEDTLFHFFSKFLGRKWGFGFGHEYNVVFGFKALARLKDLLESTVNCSSSVCVLPSTLSAQLILAQSLRDCSPSQ